MPAPLCRVFGVRHLSPAGAHHLHAVIDEVRPTAILIEGPADATDHVRHLVHKDTKPPVALLAYTRERPVRSILYPLAEYSPEWVALIRGIRAKLVVRLIDLPAAVFLQLHQIKPPPSDSEDKDEEPPADAPATGRQASAHTLAYLDDPWSEIARLCGDPDHETWWERHFETAPDAAAYSEAIFEFGRGLRDLRALSDDDENLIRESHMRRCIRDVLSQGHDPDRVLVVCGAFHAPALTDDLPAMSDEELKALPHVDTSVTLMPYSYYRLSSQSGYGAGNHAPAYFQRLYEERRAGRPEHLPSRFLTELCHGMRRQGRVRSPAEVIEAVRLANTLAALGDAPAPTLRDLRDAAISTLGRGESEAVGLALKEVETGDAVGRLPKGVGRTSIQDDFYLLLESFGLEKYQSEKEQELTLDLRENRFVKSREAAYRDLDRSTFLHRLSVLGIPFGERQPSGQDQATWKEIWRMRWKPESEISLVEGSLLGDTVEMASAVRLAQRLEECERIDEAAGLVQDAVLCRLPDALADARRRLQAMAVEANGFVELANASHSLAEIVRYGDVRKMDAGPLQPLLAQLFLRAALSVRDACRCDDATARERVRPAIVALNDVAREGATGVDAERWERELEAIAATDSLNPFLSGFVLALILPRVTEEELAREVGRRLLPGVAAEVGADWFEGLVQYNREALFARLPLWQQLDAYVVALDEDAFRKALVPLRRAFGSFAPGQVRRVVSTLVEVSRDSAEDLKASVDVKLSDAEASQLNEMLGDLGI
jgi:hypothetical protein